MTSEPTETDRTGPVENPGIPDPDMHARSEEDIDDPTARRAYARGNAEGTPGAAGEFDDNVDEASDPDV